MKGKIYYMVTNDEEEIPVAFSNSIDGLTEQMGLCRKTVFNIIHNVHNKQHRKFKCIILDEEDISDEWVPIDEDTPQLDSGMQYVSVEVMVLLRTGEKIRCIWSYRQNQFFRSRDGEAIDNGDVVGWKSI